VLAAVTSLPNVVAAVYLAARGRGAATLSTALNSNTLNVVAGLLLPAAVIGLGRPSGQAVLITVWYVVLTVVVLAFAYRDRGLSRGIGVLVIAAYVVFAASVLASGYGVRVGPPVIAAVAAVGAVVLAGGLVLTRRERAGDPRVRANEPPGGSPNVSGNGYRSVGRMVKAASRPGSRLSRESLIPGWTVRRVWVLGLTVSLLVTAADAALGHRVVLVGLLIVGPCCVLLTGRWLLTGLTGLLVICLGAVLGLPDGIWGTTAHLAFVGAIAGVALATTAAAAVIENAAP
jgi:hypothetical protein